jgi:signal transduction histidine kinase/CheY-like chemotaxis protein
MESNKGETLKQIIRKLLEMRYTRLIFTFIFLHVLVACIGQSTDAVFDSLKLELEQATEAAQKVALYIDIADRIRTSQSIEKMEGYLQQAAKIAEETKDKKLITDVLMEKGKLFSAKGQHEEGENIFKQSLENYKAINFEMGQLMALNALGIATKRQGKYVEAVSYLEQATQLFNDTSPSARKASVYANLGNSYFRINQFELAYEASFKALKYFEEAGNNRGIGLTYGNIGSLYKDQGNQDKALEYYQQSVVILEKEKSLKGLLNAYGNMASVYSNKENYKTSIDFHEKQLNIAEQLGSIELIFAVKESIAKKYLHINNINRAEELLNEIERDTGQVSNDYLIRYYLTKASIFEEKNQLQQAIFFTEKAHQIGKQTGDFLSLKGILYRLHYLNDLTGNHKKAYTFLSEYHVVIDSLKSQSNIQELTTQRMQFDFDKKQETYELEKKAFQHQLRIQQLIRWGSLGFTLLFGIIAFLIYRYYKRQNELLEKDLENNKTIEAQSAKLKILYDYKNKLFANIAHELRTPLTLISNPIKSVLKRNEIQGQDAEQLHIADRNIRSLSSTIYQILDLAKRENVELSTQPVEFDVNELIQFITNDFLSMAQFKSIQFSKPMIGLITLVITDGEKLMIVIRNLLSNAFKFTQKNGQVSINVIDLGEEVTVNIQDTGKGMTKDDLAKIFDRHYQVNPKNLPKEGGMGIGLSICKEYMTLIKGSIIAESEFGKGSSFTIRFPKKIVEKTAINTDASASFNALIVQNSVLDLDVNQEELVLIGNDITNEITRILVVEDNIDMSNYLKHILNEEYEIDFAQDGKEALELLKTNRPDLIIADYMMPNMNGMELIEQLKNKPQYASIPVIMLTAQQAIDLKLDALRIGVDDYLTKPFDNQELLARIRNILMNQRIIKTERQLEVEVNEVKKNTPPTMNMEDLAWLKELETKSKQHISNPNFTIMGLAEEMAISYSNIFRKIKKMTGLTANQYLREIRFQEALKLLEAKKYGSVKAVAYSVGYKNTKYFSKNFKKRFGKNPSEYLT